MARCLVLALLVAASAAFAPLLPSRVAATALNLRPHEGSQLVEASRTAYSTPNPLATEEKESLRSDPLSSARALVSRVFSLSSFRHPQEEDDGNDDERDVVLYPIVGFCFVKGQTKPLPTTSTPACRIPPREEELFGWFHAASSNEK